MKESVMVCLHVPDSIFDLVYGLGRGALIASYGLLRVAALLRMTRLSPSAPHSLNFDIVRPHHWDLTPRRLTFAFGDSLLRFSSSGRGASTKYAQVRDLLQ